MRTRAHPDYRKHAVDQVQITFPYSGSPKIKAIRPRMPIKAYIPKDPGRAARLIAANAEINRDRAKARR